MIDTESTPINAFTPVHKAWRGAWAVRIAWRSPRAIQGMLWPKYTLAAGKMRQDRVCFQLHCRSTRSVTRTRLGDRSKPWRGLDTLATGTWDRIMSLFQRHSRSTRNVMHIRLDTRPGRCQACVVLAHMRHSNTLTAQRRLGHKYTPNSLWVRAQGSFLWQLISDTSRSHGV